MADKQPQSYGDAVTQAQDLIRVGRLADPGEHFPYKHDTVTALLDENPPAGPKSEGDDSLRVSDHMSPAIANASKDYIEAQETYLRDPGDATLADYQRATDYLVLARKHHRKDRVDESGNPRIIVNGAN